MTSAKQIYAQASAAVQQQTEDEFMAQAKKLGQFSLKDIVMKSDTVKGSVADQLVRAGKLKKNGTTYVVQETMELELLNSLITLVEAKAPPAEPVKVAKDEAPPLEAPADDDEALSPEKTHFIFRPKFDIYGNLEQTENQELRRETKRVYTIFGREHERGAVYGVTSSAEREFKRIARLLGISTDGEVTLERVKRAGFTLVGRIGVKRLMKRGSYVVSLVGPSDDQATITFYTAKPAEKVTEGQDDAKRFADLVKTSKSGGDACLADSSGLSYELEDAIRTPKATKDSLKLYRVRLKQDGEDLGVYWYLTDDHRKTACAFFDELETPINAKAFLDYLTRVNTDIVMTDIN